MLASFDDNELDQTLEPQSQGSSETEQMICRICLCEDTEDHPLISPCQCSGSTKYIGVGCLKQWLDGKRVIKETIHVNSYIWKGLKCEICNNPFVFNSE
jgi:E3 ubiquitin-protein ligase DOA10